MDLKLPTLSSLPTPISNLSSSFIPHHFSLLVQRWKLHFQRISWKEKEISVHVVKEGETLSSISKFYGVPAVEIAAANKENPHCFQGQHLDIPSADADPHLCHLEGNRLIELQSPNISTKLGFRHRPLAKTAGSLVLLVPLFVFCIGCIMGAFARNIAAKNPKPHHQKSKGVRWKTALRDLRDPEMLDVEPEPHCDPLLEDLERLDFEDAYHDYNKLGDKYEKFLSECGMSNWGYWRGGSPH